MTSNAERVESDDPQTSSKRLAKLVSKTQIHVQFWNCDTLNLPKLGIIEETFQITETDIFAICEVGRTMFTTLEERGWIVSEPPNTPSEGVALLIKGHLKSNVHEVKSLSPRVLRITLKTKRTTFNLCFCYGPHIRRDVKEYKDFLEILSKHITIKPYCQNIICGDLNAKLKAKAKPVTGNYGLHNKEDNRNGKLLRIFAECLGLTSVNSHFITGPKRKQWEKDKGINAKHASWQVRRGSKSETDLILTEVENRRRFSKFKVSYELVKLARQLPIDHGVIQFRINTGKCLNSRKRKVNVLHEIERKGLDPNLEERLRSKRCKLPKNYTNYCEVIQKEAKKILKEHKSTNNFKVRKALKLELTKQGYKVQVKRSKKPKDKEYADKCNKEMRKEVKNSYEEYLNRCIDELEVLMKTNDLRAAYKLVAKVTKKRNPKFQPTKKANGETIDTVEERL